MTQRLRLSLTDAVTISSITFRPVDLGTHNIVLERPDQPGITVSYTYPEFGALLSKPETRYRPGHFELCTNKNHEARPAGTVAELSA